LFFLQKDFHFLTQIDLSSAKKSRTFLKNAHLNENLGIKPGLFLDIYHDERKVFPFFTAIIPFYRCVRRVRRGYNIFRVFKHTIVRAIKKYR